MNPAKRLFYTGIMLLWNHQNTLRLPMAARMWLWGHRMAWIADVAQTGRESC